MEKHANQYVFVNDRLHHFLEASRALLQCRHFQQTDQLQQKQKEGHRKATFPLTESQKHKKQAEHRHQHDRLQLMLSRREKTGQRYTAKTTIQTKPAISRQPFPNVIASPLA